MHYPDAHGHVHITIRMVMKAETVGVSNPDSGHQANESRDANTTAHQVQSRECPQLDSTQLFGKDGELAYHGTKVKVFRLRVQIARRNVDERATAAILVV